MAERAADTGRPSGATDSPDGRCGHTWDPEWLDDQPRNQHCCYREAWPDSEAGRCWWHMDGPKSLVDFLSDEERKRYRSGEKALGELLDDGDVGREPVENRRLNAADGTDRTNGTPESDVPVSGHPAELLCGVDLESVRFGDTFEFTNCWINDATLSKANFEGAVMAGVDFERVAAEDTVFRNADLSGADLRGDFSHSHFEGADLSNADVSEAGYQYAALPRPDLTAASLREADLRGTDFSRADLTDAHLRETRVDGANLEMATLERANLFGATLSNLRLYGAVLSEAQINDETVLFDAGDGLQRSVLDRIPFVGRDRRRCVYDAKKPASPPSGSGDPADATRRTKAAGTYRKLETLAGENSFPELQRSMFVRRKEAQRRKLRATRGASSPEHVAALVSGSVFRYGEGFARVLGWSAVVVLGFAALFPIGGWIRPVGGGGALGDPITWRRAVADPELLWQSVYYSTLTFTNLGFGDFRPTGTLGQALTVAETSIGVVLLSLLVFVLGRRAAR